MRLLMVSGDRQTPVGERGPLFAMQREFSRWFERVDVLCPQPEKPVTTRRVCVFDPPRIARTIGPLNKIGRSAIVARLRSSRPCGGGQ